MSENDEFALMPRGDVDLDLTVTTLRKKRCAVCGQPATAALRRLGQRERRFVCETHRVGSAASPEKGGEG